MQIEQRIEGKTTKEIVDYIKVRSFTATMYGVLLGVGFLLSILAMAFFLS